MTYIPGPFCVLSLETFYLDSALRSQLRVLKQCTYPPRKAYLHECINTGCESYMTNVNEEIVTESEKGGRPLGSQGKAQEKRGLGEDTEQK